MDTASRLIQRKNDILARLATLGPMRKGTLNEQYVQVVLKDGSPRPARSLHGVHVQRARADGLAPPERFASRSSRNSQV